MKIRSCLALLLVLLATGTFAQCTVNVFINGIKSGQYAVKTGQTTGGIWYKKKVYKTTERLVIEVKGKIVGNAIYKRVVDVTDGEDNSLFIAPETPGITGQFQLGDKAVLKRLGKGKMVRLFLQLDPANEKSKAPSRRLFIGDLTAK